MIITHKIQTPVNAGKTTIIRALANGYAGMGYSVCLILPTYEYVYYARRYYKLDDSVEIINYHHAINNIRIHDVILIDGIDPKLNFVAEIVDNLPVTDKPVQVFYTQDGNVKKPELNWYQKLAKYLSL